MPGTRANTVPGKAIGIIGISDTVNEARIRSLLPLNLSLKKVEMRPGNEGAILVFETESVTLLGSSSLTLRMLGQRLWPSQELKCLGLFCAP